MQSNNNKYVYQNQTGDEIYKSVLWWDWKERKCSSE